MGRSPLSIWNHKGWRGSKGKRAEVVERVGSSWPRVFSEGFGLDSSAPALTASFPRGSNVPKACPELFPRILEAGAQRQGTAHPLTQGRVNLKGAKRGVPRDFEAQKSVFHGHFEGSDRTCGTMARPADAHVSLLRFRVHLRTEMLRSRLLTGRERHARALGFAPCC